MAGFTLQIGGQCGVEHNVKCTEVKDKKKITLNLAYMTPIDLS